jgi:hypothetical protein
MTLSRFPQIRSPPWWLSLPPGSGCRPGKPTVNGHRAPRSPPGLARVHRDRDRVRAAAALPPLAEHPIVFLHLLDEPGSVVRTFDHALPGAWLPGQPVRYRHRLLQSALADPLPAGRYLLSLGLYDRDLGRFALGGAVEEIGRQEYQVATVVVLAPMASDPQARFSADWLAPEPSTDRQIVVSRLLRGGAAGTIQFGPLAGPGQIAIGLQLPDPASSGSRLELAAGETQPKVRLSSSCGGPLAEVTGAGSFVVEIELPEGGAPAVCEISVAPNYTLPHRRRQGVGAPELLSWRPRGGDACASWFVRRSPVE